MSIKEERDADLAELRRRKLGTARFWVWSTIAGIVMVQFYGMMPWYGLIVFSMVCGLWGTFAFVHFVEALWEVKYHRFEFEQDQTLYDESERHNRRIASVEQEIKMIRSYVEQTQMNRVERKTVVDHTEKARSMALKFLASFYSEDGMPNPGRVLPNGQIQIRVPWSKRGSWDDIASGVTPEEAIKAQGYLTAEAPGGVIAPMSLKEHSWFLNVDRYPTLKSVEQVFS